MTQTFRRWLTEEERERVVMQIEYVNDNIDYLDTTSIVWFERISDQFKAEPKLSDRQLEVLENIFDKCVRKVDAQAE